MTDGSFNPPGSGGTPPPPPPAAYPTAPTYSTPGSYAPAYSPVPVAPKKGSPKWLVPVIAIVAIAGIVGLALAVRGSSDKTDQTDGIRDGFVEECVNSMEKSTCECWWDQLMQRFSAEELVKLGLTETSDPASDQKIQDALNACL